MCDVRCAMCDVRRAMCSTQHDRARSRCRRVRYTTPLDSGLSSDPWYEIVGVVEDFPANNHRATVYHPLLPAPVHQVSFTLRVGPDAGLAAARLRDVTTAIDPALRIGRLRSLGEIYRQWMSVAHTLGFMLGSVMLIVLLFAMAGMYTLMAFIVAQRRREVGLRCALGAQPGRLLMGIFGRSLVPLVIGASVGCLMALLIGSSIQVEEVGGQTIPGIVPAAADGHDSRRRPRSRRPSPSRHSHRSRGSAAYELARTDGGPCLGNFDGRSCRLRLFTQSSSTSK